MQAASCSNLVCNKFENERQCSLLSIKTANFTTLTCDDGQGFGSASNVFKSVYYLRENWN